MRARKVGTIPADHAGLGIGMYSQVTSPLRRYGDLVAHQQLRLFLAGKQPLGTDAVLERIAAGDTSARECTLAERESNRHWALVFLARTPGWEGEAIVVERAGAQATVLVPSLGQETKIALPGDVGLNEKVRVRAGNCSIPDLALNLISVE
jgi:exoribonuclease-2